MSDLPTELKYTVTHEWVRQEGDGIVSVGITDHAQDALGDVVFVELPEVGRSFSAGEEAGVVESVKAASDVYAPLSGEVVEVNSSLEDEPESVNNSPYGDGWFYKLRITDPAELEDLLDASGYQAAVDSE